VHLGLLYVAYAFFAVGGGLLARIVVKGCFEFVSAANVLSNQAQLGGRVELEPLQHVFTQRVPATLIGVGLVTVGFALRALVLRNLKRKVRANQPLQGTPAKAPSSSTEPDGRRS
jgi:hypothetical protein